MGIGWDGHELRIPNRHCHNIVYISVFVELFYTGHLDRRKWFGNDNESAAAITWMLWRNNVAIVNTIEIAFVFSLFVFFFATFSRKIVLLDGGYGLD